MNVLKKIKSLSVLIFLTVPVLSWSSHGEVACRSVLLSFGVLSQDAQEQIRKIGVGGDPMKLVEVLKNLFPIGRVQVETQDSFGKKILTEMHMQTTYGSDLEMEKGLQFFIWKHWEGDPFRPDFIKWGIWDSDASFTKIAELEINKNTVRILIRLDPDRLKYQDGFVDFGRLNQEIIFKMDDANRIVQISILNGNVNLKSRLLWRTQTVDILR